MAARKNLTQEQILEYQEAFKLFDKNEDGLITAEELRSVMNGLGQAASETEIKVRAGSVSHLFLSCQRGISYNQKKENPSISYSC